MSVTSRPGLVALAAAGSLLLLASAPASALAAGHVAKPKHVVAKPKHVVAKPKHVKVVHFNAHGTVVSASGSTAVVMARTVLVQHKGVRHNVAITVTVAPGALKHTGHGRKVPTTAGLVVGNKVEVSGTATGSGDTEVLTVTHAVQHAQAAHVFLGKVIAVNGTTIKVSKGAEASDDQDENDNGLHGFAVDVSKATITVDGAAGTLAVGQTVAILGEGDHDAVVAASVYAFTVAPTLLAGKISAVTGSQVTIGDEEDAVTVDLASTPLVINGNTGGALTSVAAGAKAVILGTTTAGVFTPSLAFVFNGADKHPVGHNHDD
ncbi:MAG: hypothetical protein QOJ11_2672 [Frankiales bacterium]|jgi:hypothetical protein|nr:hypothetical protein [Frankiales bacterium]